MQLRRPWILAIGIAAFAAAPAAATPVFYGPTPYLSTADIPDGFYESGSPSVLEDFEDSSLDHGITASNGFIFEPSNPETDSVDADDGVIDGSGSDGHSWFYSTGPQGSTTLTFTFPELVEAAGIVQTDGRDSVTTVEAFGPGMASLGTWGPFDFIENDDGMGQTSEDRFLGVQDASGITALQLTVDHSGMEVDHLQLGAVVPEPTTALLLGSGILLLGGARRHRAAV